MALWSPTVGEHSTQGRPRWSFDSSGFPRHAPSAGGCYAAGTLGGREDGLGRGTCLVLLLALSCGACASSVELNPAQQAALARFEDCKQETGATSINLKLIREDGQGFRYSGNNLDLSRMRDCLRTKYGYKSPGAPGYRGMLR